MMYSGSQTHEVQSLLISVIGDWGLGIRNLLGYTRVSFLVTNSREFRLRKAKSARSSHQSQMNRSVPRQYEKRYIRFNLAKKSNPQSI